MSILASGSRYTRPLVSVTSTDRQIILFFHARWPGQLSQRTPAGRAREAFEWHLASSYPIRAFLLDLAPYWRLDRNKARAELLATDLAERIQGSRDPLYRMCSQHRMAQMRELNRRGIP